MSVAQAEEFYGPVLEVLMDKLRGRSGEQARKALEKELGIPFSKEIEDEARRCPRPDRRPRQLGADRQVHGRQPAERVPRGEARRARHARSASRSSTRAWMPSVRFVRSSGRPILPRRLRDPSAASSARPSWSTPRTPPIR